MTRKQKVTLNQDERVLVRDFEKGGPAKICAFWEDHIYIVLKRIYDESPVYISQPENGQGRQRTLHRTLLYPCNDLRIDESIEVVLGKKNITQNRARAVADTRS